MRSVLVLARPNPDDPAFYSRWRALGPVFKTVDHGSISKAIRILVVDHRVIVDDEMLRKFNNVEVVCTSNTGHTHIQADLEERRIKLVSLRGETSFLKHVRSVSEFVFGLMLRMARPLDKMGHTLNGKTIGIVGNGRIGEHVSEIARGFGMDVYPFDIGEGDIKILFAQSDFVTIHLPEKKELEGFISRELIDSMKPGAYFINTARASLVDEYAIYDALVAGRLAGAALDMTHDPDIVPRDIPNLILCPHNAGNTVEDRIMTDDFIVKKCLRALDN